MRRWGTIIWLLISCLCTSSAQLAYSAFSLDDIILDIYREATEMGEMDYEQLQTDLYALHESPINLNATSDEELSQLVFLSPQQIDELLAYADKHAFDSIYELRLIQSLADYDIRNLLPFVYIGASAKSPIYPKEVFVRGKHELLTRIDARNIEMYEGTDPMYIQTRYRFDYQRRVTFGLQLRRPAGGNAQDLEYNAYVQLRDIGGMHTIVAGSFQASFGQGLVLAPVFRSGRSSYVQSVGMTTNGLRYYSSADGQGLQGVGGTYRHVFNPHTRLDVSALYSVKKANDSTLHHLVGANVTLRHRQLQVQLTAIENIWSDSIHPYRNSAYNHHYFRGYRQAVIGASARYNHGWFDLFGEIATAQNSHPVECGMCNVEESPNLHWGFGVIAGSRFYPTDGVSLVALYRYYSPYFDNAQGYAFSETSRLGDENGGYIGFDISRWKNIVWRGYGDFFYFSGPKYGIPDYPTWGYDVMSEWRYTLHRTSDIVHHTSDISLRLRARDKGDLATYSARGQFDWQCGAWSLRTTAEGNITAPSALNTNTLNTNTLTTNTLNTNTLTTNPQSGYTVYQDIAYDFAQSGLRVNGKPIPLSLRVRLQWFDAKNWDNRIYTYEHDVLYAFSIPAVYGIGGRAYVNLRWQIIDRLTLYLRVSETVYQSSWYKDRHPEWPKDPSLSRSLLPTRTDVHLLLRCKL